MAEQFDPNSPPATGDPTDEPPVLSSRPPTAGQRALLEKFHERLAGQSAQMDELARQMVTVELAVPGIFAAALALLRGKDATLAAGPLLYVTFVCWLAALLLTFAALFPRDYRVDPTILRRDPAAKDDTRGVEDFFRRSAEYRRWLRVAAAAVFWVGIAAAVAMLFGS